MRKQMRKQRLKRKQKEQERLPLTSDLVFKAVYGRDTWECKQLLIAMLNLILAREKEPITDLIYKNPFTYAERPDSKQIVMDIKALLSTGEWIDIEMQVEQLKAFVNRSVYYGAKLVTEQLDGGDFYDILKPGIVINIVCGGLFPNIEKAHTVFRYKERDLNVELTDISEIHFLELDKINVEKPLEEMTSLERFGAYMRYAASPDRKDYIQKLLEYGEEVISMTDEMLKKVSENDQIKEWYRARELFLMDQRSRMWEAEHRGIERGLEEGIKALILDNLEEQKTEEQIANKLEKRFSLTKESAMEYLRKYKDSEK